MEPEKIELNYTPAKEPESNIIPTQGNSVVPQGDLRSINYAKGASGWKISANGDISATSLDIQRGGDITLSQDLDEQAEIIFYDDDSSTVKYKIYGELNNGPLILETLSAEGKIQISDNLIAVIANDEITLTASEIFMAGAVKPNSDNTKTLGTAGLRWSDVRSVLINGADIGLANGWKIREYPATKEDLGKSDEWFKKNANLGLQILDEEENLIAVIHKNGFIYCNGIKPLKDLNKQHE